MSLLKTIIALAVIFFAISIFATENKTGPELFDQHCKVCHGLTGGMNMQQRIAPPIAGVKMHYISEHPDKNSFVQAVTDWLEKPDASKTLMPGAIRRFNLMPPVSLSEEHAKLIAEYIYEGDIETPAGYKEHYQQMHGSDNNKDNIDNHGNNKSQNANNSDKSNGGKQKPQTRGRPNQDIFELAKHLRLPPAQLNLLNLSEQQIAQIKTLIVEKEVIMQPLREEVLEFNHELNTMDSRAPNYKADIFALADVNAKRVEQMVVESGEMRMKIEAVLNPQQYGQLLTFRQQHMERRKQLLKQRMQNQ